MGVRETDGDLDTCERITYPRPSRIVPHTLGFATLLRLATLIRILVQVVPAVLGLVATGLCLGAPKAAGVRGLVALRRFHSKEGRFHDHRWPLFVAGLGLSRVDRSLYRKNQTVTRLLMSLRYGLWRTTGLYVSRVER